MKVRSYLMDLPLKDFLIFDPKKSRERADSDEPRDGEIGLKELYARRDAIKASWSPEIERQRRVCQEPEFEMPSVSSKWIEL